MLSYITNTNVKLSFISLLKSPRFLWLENLLGQNNSMRYYADGLCDCKRSGIQQVAHQLTFFICVQLAVDIQVTDEGWYVVKCVCSFSNHPSGRRRLWKRGKDKGVKANVPSIRGVYMELIPSLRWIGFRNIHLCLIEGKGKMLCLLYQGCLTKALSIVQQEKH